MNDLISRCELFNRLAVIPAPPEANEYKAEVYKAINGAEPVLGCGTCKYNKCDGGNRCTHIEYLTMRSLHGCRYQNRGKGERNE